MQCTSDHQDEKFGNSFGKLDREHMAVWSKGPCRSFLILPTSLILGIIGKHWKSKRSWYVLHISCWHHTAEASGKCFNAQCSDTPKRRFSCLKILINGRHVGHDTLPVGSFCVHHFTDVLWDRESQKFIRVEQLQLAFLKIIWYKYKWRLQHMLKRKY